MATFALIHGGGDVGWYWHLVEAELRRRGHDVVAPDLPCDNDSAGLQDYADTVVEAIGDRRDLVVVGQSYGGFTAPLVADRLAADTVVLVAGMIPARRRVDQPPGHLVPQPGLLLPPDAHRVPTIAGGRPRHRFTQLGHIPPVAYTCPATGPKTDDTCTDVGFATEQDPVVGTIRAGDHLRSEVGYLRIGPVGMMFLPGEVAGELVVGLPAEFRTNPGRWYDEPAGLHAFGDEYTTPGYVINLMSDRYKFTIGLGNDELGYIFPISNWRVGCVADLFAGAGTCQALHDWADRIPRRRGRCHLQGHRRGSVAAGGLRAPTPRRPSQRAAGTARCFARPRRTTRKPTRLAGTWPRTCWRPSPLSPEMPTPRKSIPTSPATGWSSPRLAGEPKPGRRTGSPTSRSRAATGQLKGRRNGARKSCTEWTWRNGKIAILSDPQGAVFAIFEGEVDD